MHDDPVITAVQSAVARHRLLTPGQKVVVGVSGGPDSVCLLHVLRHLAPQFEISLHVAHLNHGIRGQPADADASFVAELAAAWQLPCSIERVDVPALARAGRLAVEEAARRARYDFLARLATRLGASSIAVGHHADDQVETVLMHWLRGSGLAGLRGMLPSMPLAEYRLIEGLAPDEADDARPVTDETPLMLIRPLLDVSRREIEAYCARHNLQTRFDQSNLDTTYFRNRLRHELLPYLETYNANIRQVLRRSAAVMAADYELLRQQLAQAWHQVVRSESPAAIIFDLAAWQALPLSLKRSTLREAIHRLRRSLRNINFVHVENALEIASAGQTGAQASLPQGLCASVGYDTLTVADQVYRACPDLPLLMKPEALEVAVPGETRLPEGHWVLRAVLLERSELAPGVETGQPGEPWQATGRRAWQAYLDAEAAGRPLRLRPRQPGDRFCPLGWHARSKRVNEFMINEKIPAAWRPHIPLLVDRDDRILWLCGWRLDQRASITPSTRHILWLRFERE